MELSIRRKLVGDYIEITVYDVDDVVGMPILEDAYKEALRLQKVFNFYDPKSELSLLNKKRTLKASDDMLFVMKMAIIMSKMTSGRYDVTLGKQFMDVKKGKESKKQGCSYKDIKIEKDKITLLHPDVLIDLGSIAKGYIVDCITEFLLGEGIESGFIDARGDMRMFGHTESIYIQHPRVEEKLLGPVVIADKAVATSGDYRQFKGSYENSHIIGKQGIISVTVLADDCMTADAFATALMVIDTQSRDKLMKDNTGISAFLIDEKLKYLYYNNFEVLHES